MAVKDKTYFECKSSDNPLDYSYYLYLQTVKNGNIYYTYTGFLNSIEFDKHYKESVIYFRKKKINKICQTI